MTIEIAALGAELRRLPKRDREAARRGLRKTMAVDADRWIQWSIRGGGHPAAAPRPATRKPPRQNTPRKRRGPIQKLLKRLGGLLKRRGKKPRGAGSQKPGAGCARRDPPAYRTPVDTGDYARSWRWVQRGDSGMIYSAASPAVKAGVIEFGRRPAPIPIRPLAEWVRRKLGCNDPKKAIGIAIAISKTAAKTKRPGLHVLARAHPKIAEAALKNVQREMRKAKPGT